MPRPNRALWQIDAVLPHGEVSSPGRFGIHPAAGAFGLFAPAKAAPRFSGEGQHRTRALQGHLRFPHF